MAGFEGSGERGDPGQRTPKLPSWAVTNRPPEPGPGPASGPVPPPPVGLTDLGGAPGTTRGQRAEPPVVRVPEHPFDVDDPFGDKQLGGSSSPWIRPPADDTEIRVVDLADEFHLTTAQALEVCEASGTPASSGAVWLTVEQADAFRAAVAHYDRSVEVQDPEFPQWAVPPGGRPEATSPAPARAAVPLSPARPADPGAPRPGSDESSGPAADRTSRGAGGARVVRVILLALVVLAAVAVLAFLLTR